MWKITVHKGFHTPVPEGRTLARECIARAETPHQHLGLYHPHPEVALFLSVTLSKQPLVSAKLLTTGLLSGCFSSSRKLPTGLRTHQRGALVAIRYHPPSLYLTTFKYEQVKEHLGTKGYFRIMLRWGLKETRQGRNHRNKINVRSRRY